MLRMGEPTIGPETERLRQLWETLALRYDNDIKLFEKLFFSGGRQWVRSQARQEVLEIGAGNGRNL